MVPEVIRQYITQFDRRPERLVNQIFTAFSYFWDTSKYKSMPVNYVSDNSGSTIAVQIPIEDWKRIKNKYPDVDDFDSTLTLSQKQFIDQRLEAIAVNPERLRPVDELLEELDKEE
jgi:hypothetical protein